MEINEIVKKFKDQREVLAKKFLADVDADAYLSAHAKAADKAVLAILKLNQLSEDVAVVAATAESSNFPTQTSIFFSFCLTASETRT